MSRIYDQQVNEKRSQEARSMDRGSSRANFASNPFTEDQRPF